MSAYGCYVKFTAKTGQRDLLVELLLGAAEQVRDARGCRIYLINTSADDPDVIWVTEVWDTQADAQAPLQSDSAKEQIGRVLPLLASLPERTVVRPLGGVGLEG